jgi:predicted TIM-barrel fold metal-dependent hydrolase
MTTAVAQTSGTAADWTLETSPVIDTDSHVAEPPDLWTSRLPESKWGDRRPRVIFDERVGRDRWLIGGRKLTTVASWATAGWHEYPPGHPPTIAEADPAAFEAAPRLQRMDEFGITAQALYPNLLAFSNHAFLAQEDPELILECVRAYNDFLVDFASVAPERFILLCALPFWDVEATVAEMKRCKAMGHHGMLFIAKPHKMGLPRLADDHWAPVFNLAQDFNWSVNFHIGFADYTEDDLKEIIGRRVDRSEYAKISSVSMLACGETVADVIMSGVCHKYPNLKIVSVESGFGWLPSFIECMDWQWLNSGAAQAFPEREMPSFYFRRQYFSTFWFENESVRRLIDLYPDNLMFETDFPHPTSLSPGPASSSPGPKAVVRDVFRDIDPALAQKVLYKNAQSLYGLGETN